MKNTRIPGNRGDASGNVVTHIAIQEALDGKAVDWMEHVSDEQYTAGANPR
jgi:hypothetical protein